MLLQLHQSDRQFYCLLRCIFYYRFKSIHMAIFFISSWRDTQQQQSFSYLSLSPPEHSCAVSSPIRSLSQESTLDLCMLLRQNTDIKKSTKYEFLDDIFHITATFNSLKPSDAYMLHWNKPSLAQIMACHLFGTKPLSETMVIFCQLDPKEQYSVKLKSKVKQIKKKKLHFKMS